MGKESSKPRARSDLDMKASLRLLILFFGISFLLFTAVTSVVLVPMISKFYDGQATRNAKIAMNIEAQSFERFVQIRHLFLQDLMKQPMITNAVMLGAAQDPDLINLLDEYKILGDSANFILQDILGQIIYQTNTTVKAGYDEDEPWVKDLFKKNKTHHFQLLSQENDIFSFVLSVPILYRGNVEGILSAEISTPIDEIFNAEMILGPQAGFKLSQNGVVVRTADENIKIPYQMSMVVEPHNVILTYISDKTPIFRAKEELKKNVLMILFWILSLSFLLLALLNQRKILKQFYIPKQVNKTQDRKRHSPFPLIIAILGIAASLTASMSVKILDDQKLQQRMLSDAKEIAQLIEQDFEKNIDVLVSLKAYYDSSTFVDRQEFKSFSKIFLKKYPNIHAIEWVPKVRFGQKKHYERLAKKDGLESFQFLEPNEQGKNVPSADSAIYYPVFYVEPYKGNERVLGYAPSSNAGRRSTIMRANRTGEIIATPPLSLIQDDEKKPSIIAYNTVYEESSLKRAEPEDKTVKGLVVVVLRSEDIVRQVLDKSDRPVGVSIQDITNSGDFKTVYESNIKEGDVAYEHTIDIAGRRWLVKTIPEKEAYKAYLYWAALFILVLGLLLTFFIVFYIIQLIRRRDIIEGIVEQRTQELENANVELEEFAYRTSHDLRSPIISSIGLLGLANTMMSSNDVENAKMSITHAQNSLGKLQTLIEDILQLTETKNKDEESQNVDLAALLDESLDKLSNMEGYTRLDIQRDLSFSGPLVTKKIRLAMILENLLSNAIKYHDPEKTNSFIKVITCQENDNFVLEVIDNGLGVPKEQQKNMFQMFKRFHPKVAFGSGLGLYLMKKSADVLGATIEFSDEGGQTSFKLKLPI